MYLYDSYDKGCICDTYVLMTINDNGSYKVVVYTRD